MDIGKTIQKGAPFGALVGGVAFGLSYLWGNVSSFKIGPVLFAATPDNIAATTTDVNVRQNILSGPSSEMINKIFDLIGGVNLPQNIFMNAIMMVLASVIVVVLGMIALELIPLGGLTKTPWQKLIAVLVVGGLIGAAIVNFALLKSGFVWQVYAALALYYALVGGVIVIAAKVLPPVRSWIPTL